MNFYSIHSSSYPKLNNMMWLFTSSCRPLPCMSLFYDFARHLTNRGLLIPWAFSRFANPRVAQHSSFCFWCKVPAFDWIFLSPYYSDEPGKHFENKRCDELSWVGLKFVFLGFVIIWTGVQDWYLECLISLICIHVHDLHSWGRFEHRTGMVDVWTRKGAFPSHQK